MMDVSSVRLMCRKAAFPAVYQNGNQKSGLSSRKKSQNRSLKGADGECSEVLSCNKKREKLFLPFSFWFISLFL
jgi:hypothetical protein